MKIITIIGMGPGISLGIANKFGKNGYKVAMLSRNKEKLKSYQTQLKKKGVDSSYYVVDVGNEKSLKQTLDKVAGEGDIEILHYNVGRLRKQNIMSDAVTDLMEDYMVNVLGALVAVKHVVPGMIEKQRGTILLTGGGLAIEPYPDYGSLALGKAGLRNLTKQLAHQLNGDNIKVGTVIVRGFVKQDHKKYNPTSIAEEFWKIHAQKGTDTSEILY